MKSKVFSLERFYTKFIVSPSEPRVIRTVPMRWVVVVVVGGVLTYFSVQLKLNNFIDYLSVRQDVKNIHRGIGSFSLS